MKLAKMCLALSCLLLAVVASTGTAQANTAAGVQLSNTATLTYNSVSISSTVNVTVALKQSAPNIAVSGGTGVYAGPNSPSITQTVTVIATANGPSTYRISAATATQSNNSNTGDVNIQGPNNYSAGASKYYDQPLGATVTTGASAATYVTVPTTTSAVNGTSINGIIIGTHIMVGSHELTVSAITDQGNGTYQIQWIGAIPAVDIPGPGQVIGEKKVLNFWAYPGTLAASGAALTVDVNATASDTVAGVTNSITTAAPATNSWSTTTPQVTFTKFVRNASDSSIVGSGGVATATFPGPVPAAGTYTYYHDSVTVKPGQTLEYLIVAVNNDATNPLTGCSIGDVLPITSYSAFVSNAYGANKDVAYINNGATPSFLQAFNGAGHQATLIGQSLNVNVGDNASDTLPGSITAGKNMKILYQLTVN
jgi:hypothetical protein